MKKDQKLRIAILSLGTRGDIEPYAVLGKALLERGHTVTFATAQNFERLVKSYGVQFVPVEADFQQLLESEDGKKMLKGNPFTIRKKLKTTIYPLIQNSLSVFYQLSKESDCVLYHVKTLADCFADQFPNRMIRTSVIPMNEPTSDFANPSLSGLPIPKFLNKLSYTIANKSIGLLSKPINEFRESVGLTKNYVQPEVKDIYGVSSYFLPIPTSYKESSVFTGYWFSEFFGDMEPKLLEFLDSGTAPLVITFGSMPLNCSFDFIEAITEITTRLQQRVVLIKGWGMNDQEFHGNKDVCVVESVPYALLFKRAKAIVHHGGAGTTASCLKAGKPFFVCPILYPIGDQLFWGKQGEKQKVAIAPIPLKNMSKKVFLSNIERLLSNSELYENAEKLGKELMKEDGLQNAIEAIEIHCNTKQAKNNGAI